MAGRVVGPWAQRKAFRDLNDRLILLGFISHYALFLQNWVLVSKILLCCYPLATNSDERLSLPGSVGTKLWPGSAPPSHAPTTVTEPDVCVRSRRRDIPPTSNRRAMNERLAGKQTGGNALLMAPVCTQYRYSAIPEKEEKRANGKIRIDCLLRSSRSRSGRGR